MSLANNPVIYLWRKTWKYSKGNRKHVVLYLILFTFSNIVSFFVPLLVAKILNKIQLQGVTSESLPNLLMWLLVFLGINLAFWIFHGPARILENRNSYLVKANYKRYLLDGTMALPAQWHANHHSGDTIDKIEKGTDALKEFASDTFIIVESIIRLIGSYLALAYFNLYSSFIVLFMVFITIKLIMRFDKVLIPRWGQLNKYDNNVSERVFDVLSNITTVIILRVEKLVSKSIVKKMMAPFQLFIDTNKLEESKWFFVSIMSAIMTIGVLGSYLFETVRSGNIVLIGTVYALYGYIERIDGLFFRFAYKYGEIVRQRTRVQNAEIISDNFSMRQKNKQINLADNWEQIDINDLSFSYHTQEGADLHLDNISFSIRRGQRIAFIGASGSGKTTTLRIIRELYQPQSISLSIDGQKIENGFQRISSNISLIPQDPEIFATTIRDNITLGVDSSIDEIREYARLAEFDNVAMSLPHGYDSSIVEKGVNLSGGEKQRLALARGLMASKDKYIVLLDEPTSSVDPKNELLIYNNIFKVFNDKAIISSVHRLHLLQLFDIIYLFGNGKIIARGTFDELLVASKEFKTMWKRYTDTKHNQ